ncbi:hypothetical protein [Leeuwenhoekiella marinoflava]|uniref:hypothetical protein n=1 Tax=Leeuwenhoekiella marinoflava TaxID=988 RepID=UPI003002F72B
MNLIIGITWVILVLSKFFIKEPINWFDYAMLVLALYYFTQYYFNHKYQYLTVTDGEIVKQRIIFKKAIPINTVKRFYRNKAGDYVIEGSDKKIKIDPLAVQPESLKAFKLFTAQLKVPKEIH